MITYEWIIEEVDEHGDIQNVTPYRRADYMPIQTLRLLQSSSVCLVRNELDENENLKLRLWAYVKDRKLPEFFEDDSQKVTDIKVPQKFHDELKDALIVRNFDSYYDKAHNSIVINTVEHGDAFSTGAAICAHFITLDRAKKILHDLSCAIAASKD